MIGLNVIRLTTSIKSGTYKRVSTKDTALLKTMTCLFLTLAIREMYKCVKFFSSPSGNRTLFFVFC